MSRRPPIDEIRSARALKQLDELARDHPEAFFDPSRLPRSPTALAAALGEGLRIDPPPSDDPMLAMTVRAPRSLLAQVDAARGERGRGEVVRQALERWLRAGRRRNNF